MTQITNNNNNINNNSVYSKFDFCLFTGNDQKLMTSRSLRCSKR